MELNQKQLYAFKQAVSGKNVFITGSGGVGKSVLIHKLADHFKDSAILMAPTGVAAQNIHGSTIHRIFMFPFGFLGNYDRKNVHNKTQELFSDESITTIIIDEISMNRGDVFTAIDQNLRRARKRNVPFGGLQVIVVGDFFQLPPVLNARSTEGKLYYDDFDSPYAFSTESWEQSGFENIELTEIMRQSDQEFISALNSIRKKDENFKESLEFINRIGSTNDPDDHEDAVFLCSYNKDADFINEDEYSNVKGEEKVYQGVKSEGFKDIPVPMNLKLKVGCKVLIVANNESGGYMNGQTGFIENLADDLISVKLSDGSLVHVQKNTWKEYGYSNVNGITTRDVTGTYTQFPLKLGWAISVHKSQGLTLDSAIIYTGKGMFAHGQGYVALSRVKNLSGLILAKPLREREIIVDKIVKDFYNGNVTHNLLS